MASMRRLLLPLCGLLAILAAALLPAPPARAQAPGFVSEASLASDTGHILVEWEAAGEVTLLMARDAAMTDAEALYTGSNTAYFLSGLEGGDYYLALCDEAGMQSDTMQLVVEHQSLELALWLTLIGAVITLGIIGVILRGARP